MRHNNQVYLPALSPVSLSIGRWLNQQETGGGPNLGKTELHPFMRCSFSKDEVTL